jgi:hypothetical protein
MALLKKNKHGNDGDAHRHDTRHDGAREGHRDTAGTTDETRTVERRDVAYERFGGINWGAAFFGWLVAVGVAALLAGIIGAVTAAIGQDYSLSANAETLGLAAAITLAVVLAIAYFTGGYVAGRMSRFDGGKQGAAAWIVGLLVTLLAAALGAVAGSEYNILERVDMPNIPLSQDQLSVGGVITAVVVIALTLLAAIMGGAAGRRYHAKVDRAHGI